MISASPNRLDGLQIMVSISESPDLDALRMGSMHVREALKEISRHLLASGATVAYGGDLRAQGFTRLLFDMARTYNETAENASNAKILNYLAAPLYENNGKEDWRAIRREYGGAARPCPIGWPDEVYDVITGKKRNTADGEDRNAMAFTEMRNKIVSESHAVICLGGKIEGYQGWYPGVLQEIAIALKYRPPLENSMLRDKRTPVYLLGGFGGSVNDALHALGQEPILDPENRPWSKNISPENSKAGYEQVQRYISKHKDERAGNGLTEEDNAALASLSDVEKIVPLLLRGLRNLRKKPGRQDHLARRDSQMQPELFTQTDESSQEGEF